MYSSKNELGLEKAGVYYLEIVDCVKNCSENYNPEKEEFLRYFKHSIKLAIDKAINEEKYGKKRKCKKEDVQLISRVYNEDGDSQPISDTLESKLPEPGEEFFSAMLSGDLYGMLFDFGFKEGLKAFLGD
jgi:hypothetical protein